MKRLELAIDSELGHVSLMAVAVNRVCLYLGLDEAKAGEVELCVAEAVTNAIRHAYHGASGSRITISVGATGNKLSIDVCDTGTMMPVEHQYRLMHGPRAPEAQLDDRHSIPEGGRGLQIIRELMDMVSYTSKDRLNHLTMEKNLSESCERPIPES